MIDISILPAVNATLNSIAFVLLVVGYTCIRKQRITAHRRFMITAFCVSILFLISYLTYRFAGEEKRFGGEGWIRPIYFFILITHVLLAATVPVLSTWTLFLGLRGRWDRHRRLARWTYPIWVYVSITGVLVYVLLFQIYGPRGTVSG
jgi:uncharacterized membrane protein YozB (DUF420 family)